MPAPAEREYEVAIVYRGLSNYIVKATDPATARERAESMFKNGEAESMLGNEWEEIEEIREPEELPHGPVSRGEDKPTR